MYDYYRINKENPIAISEVIRRWSEDGDKVYDATVHGYYDIKEVDPYREYTWTGKMSRLSLKEWNELKDSLKNGWDPKDPIILNVGRDGMAKIGEGNHRLGVAKELGITSIPVRFYFTSSAAKNRDIGSEFPTREEWIESERKRSHEEDKRRQDKRIQDGPQKMVPEKREEHDQSTKELMDLLTSLSDDARTNMKKEAAEGLQGTTAPQATQALSVKVKSLLDTLTPMMPALQQAIPQLKTVFDEIEQLKTQVGQLEQMRSQKTTQAPPSQGADDKIGMASTDITGLFSENKSKQFDGNLMIGIRGSRPIEELSIRGFKGNDKLSGGKGDEVSKDELNKKQLEMGKKVEMEHTTNPEIAEEISSDHLAEELKDGKKKKDQEYYTQLKKIHEDKCKDSTPDFWRRNLDYGER